MNNLNINDRRRLKSLKLHYCIFCKNYIDLKQGGLGYGLPYIICGLCGHERNNSKMGWPKMWTKALKGEFKGEEFQFLYELYIFLVYLGFCSDAPG